MCVEVVKFDIAVLVIVLTRLPTGLSDSLNDDANVNDWCVLRSPAKIYWPENCGN